MTTSEIRYGAKRSRSHAYQVVGNGPDDLVLALGYVSHLERIWRTLMAAFLHRLASSRRLIVFDRRGTGLSERVSLAPTLEQRMDDMVAVINSAAVEGRRSSVSAKAATPAPSSPPATPSAPRRSSSTATPPRSPPLRTTRSGSTPRRGARSWTC